MKEMEELNSRTVLEFDILLKICTYYFGLPLIRGCHYIFETPWDEDPVISIQRDGSTARPYQVKIVKEALERLEARHESDRSRKSGN